MEVFLKMKKLFVFLSLMLIVLAISISAEKPNKCTTIQSGELLTSGGDVIPTGFMENGYNYQAHLFSAPYGADYLIMKWNDAWLSNKDCDSDGLLDRHYGSDFYIGSGAWLTNEMYHEYTAATQDCYWTSFTKVVAAPENAVLINNYWYLDNQSLGKMIWDEFYVAQSDYENSCTTNLYSMGTMSSPLTQSPLPLVKW